MDASANAQASAPRRSRVMLAVILLVVAVATLAAVVYLTDGVSLVSGLFGGKPSPGAAAPPAAVATATATVDPNDLEAAKLTYAEQIESQENIDRLADGDLKAFTVDSVKSGADAALVRITAEFRDGTRAPGALRFVRKDQRWYFTTITGLREAETGGIADETNSAKSISPTVTADQKLAAVGITEADKDVLRTIAEQQVANQSVIRDLLSGEYKNYALAKPVIGSSTFTIPVTIGGGGETTVGAKIVVIAKNIEGKDRVFITTFKRD